MNEEGGERLFQTKRKLLSRIETLESLVTELIAGKDTLEDVCIACAHNETVFLGNRPINYCNLYTSGYCKSFKAIENAPQSCEAKTTGG